jgi:FKBP-type peptidyl-prolyl cis-trans isomerase 2
MRTTVKLFSQAVSILLAVFFFGVAMGRAEDAVAVGDRVRVDVTLRLADGGLLLTTRPETAAAPGNVRAPVYMTLQQPGPMMLVAGPVLEEPRMPIDKGFSAELMAQLGRAVVGLKVGETRNVILKSAVMAELPDGERFLRLARVQKRERRAKMQKAQFVEAYKQEPVKGARFAYQTPVEAVIQSVEGDRVEVSLISPDGAPIATDWGPGTIRDKGDQGYEVVLAVKPGMLVRTGHLLGRIVAVDESRFTIDYGDLFGGEALRCELIVVEILQ